MAQHFYTTRPLVVETRMLLRCKPLLRSRTECLSMYLFYHKRGKAEMEQDSNAQAPNKDSAFLPAPEGLILTHNLQSDRIKDEHTRIVEPQELGRANVWGCPTA